jgi:hypothetical protein
VSESVVDEWEADDAPKRESAIYHLPKQIDPARLPSALRRSKSAHGFLAAWKKLRDAVWTSCTIPYKKLPPFAAKWGERLYKTHERVAYDALLAGDVVFFVGWSDRLLLIDQAAVASGLSMGERGTLLYAVGVIQGYGDAAATQLKTLGGKWPQKKDNK